MTINIKKLKSLSKKFNVSFCVKGSCHVQIKGALLVNYYPLSKNQTAYIAQTNKGLIGISYEEAFKLSVTVPKSPDNKTKRKSSYRKVKVNMLKRKPYCNWCGVLLFSHTATLDHVVPVSLGGLNNRNNYVLACEDCNKKRGNKMPEIESIL